MMITLDTARTWIDRWDSQQAGYMLDREGRFTALIDAVAAVADRPDPLILDLGCGPGSLAARLHERLPKATIVGVDADPLLLTLAQARYPDIRFSDLDLRRPGWTERLGLDRPVDAAVSTTALHWLREPDLRAMYAELRTVLRPGGVFLDGDHLLSDDPVLARIDHALEEKRRRADVENWEEWWAAIAAAPEFADLYAERQRRNAERDHDSPESLRLATHVTALQDAGFAQIGTVWQQGETRILCASRPAA